MPVGLRSRVPAKMTSRMFDLPQPFGPTIAAMPSPWNFNSVRSQNDLNPRICSFFSLSNLYSFVRAMLQPAERPDQPILFVSLDASLSRNGVRSNPQFKALWPSPDDGASATLRFKLPGVKIENPTFWV